MSNANQCIAEIVESAGGELSDAQLEAIVDAVEQAKAKADATATIAGHEQAIMQNLDKIAQDKALAAKVEKRNAAYNSIKTKEMINFVNENFPKDPVKGFESLMLGVQELKQGSRFSAAVRQTALRDEYIAGATYDFHASGLQPLLNSGKLDAEITRALWDIDAEVPKYEGKYSKEARQLADIIHKWQEKARKDANEAGALIGKLQGYVVRQSHDRRKVAGVDAETWKNDIAPLLDHEQTFGAKASDPEARAEILNRLYSDLASDVHLDPSKPPLGLTGTRNIAKTMSHDRTIHFKDADAFFKYNQKYGKGNIREAFLSGLMANAEKTGLMRAFGPNAELNVQRAADAISTKLDDPKQRHALATALDDDGRLKDQMKLLSGAANNPVNETDATIGSVTRGLQSITKLGGSVLSAFTDLGTMAHGMADNGGGFLGAIGDSVSGIVGSVGGAKKDKLEVAHSIGIFADSMIGDIGSRLSGRDDLPGSLSRYLQTFFKYNGLTWWTDSARRSAGLMLANNLDRGLKEQFSNINADLRRNLTKYGIDENIWKVMQASERISDGRGNKYFTPGNIDKLDDVHFEKLLQARGDKVNKFTIREARKEVTDRSRAYITDQSEHMVIVPDKKTQFFTLGGSRPGTWGGETRRFIMQFNPFPTGVIQKTMGSTIYGRGYEYDPTRGSVSNLASALTAGNGEMLGMVRLMTTMTLLGYASMSAKDIFKGKEPRPVDNYKTWMAAMAQGGGLGIYGDFLFGEMRNRFGGGLINTLAGPTAGSLNQIADVWGRFKEGEDAGAAAFKALSDHAPLIVNDLFYTKPVIDYLIMYDIQESINPGYLRRMEARQKRDNETEYFLRPSADRARPIEALTQ